MLVLLGTFDYCAGLGEFTVVKDGVERQVGKMQTDPEHGNVAIDDGMPA